MSNEKNGKFYVGALDDGRFVAVATEAPYFCFRADTEELVVAKVSRALQFWKSRTTKSFSVAISPSSRVTTIVPTKTLNIDDVLAAA